MAEVGIPNTETMIAIGGQAYRILEANKDLIHESIEHIPGGKVICETRSLSSIMTS